MDVFWLLFWIAFWVLVPGAGVLVLPLIAGGSRVVKNVTYSGAALRREAHERERKAK